MMTAFSNIIISHKYYSKPHSVWWADISLISKDTNDALCSDITEPFWLEAVLLVHFYTVSAPFLDKYVRQSNILCAISITVYIQQIYFYQSFIKIPMIKATIHMDKGLYQHLFKGMFLISFQTDQEKLLFLLNQTISFHSNQREQSVHLFRWQDKSANPAHVFTMHPSSAGFQIGCVLLFLKCLFLHQILCLSTC